MPSPIPKRIFLASFALWGALALTSVASAHIGQRFPSERKVVPDPITGIPLTFLTSTPAGDSKIYPTHPQWTADGQWVIFRSNRVPGQAMAVNETTGDIVQVTDTGYTGMLCIAQKSMRLFFLRPADPEQRPGRRPAGSGGSGRDRVNGRTQVLLQLRGQRVTPVRVVEPEQAYPVRRLFELHQGHVLTFLAGGL